MLVEYSIEHQGLHKLTFAYYYFVIHVLGKCLDVCVTCSDLLVKVVWNCVVTVWELIGNLFGNCFGSVRLFIYLV